MSSKFESVVNGIGENTTVESGSANSELQSALARGSMASGCTMKSESKFRL